MSRRRILCAALLVAAVLSVPTVLGADMLTIDDDHGLYSDGAVDQYDSEGAVETEIDRINMGVGVYSSADAAGIESSPLQLDASSHWVCMDYREDIERTIRIHVPAGYWHPHPEEGLEAVNADATLSMRPSSDLNHSSVEVTFSGKTDACWEIKRESAAYFQIRDQSRSIVEEETGWTLPSITGSSDDWEYVDPATLDTEDTIPVEATDDRLSMQYDELAEDAESERWISVGDCSRGGSSDPVCRLDGASDDHVILVVQTDEPPDVRYRHGWDLGSTIGAALDDLRAVPSRVKEQAQAAIGRWF